MLDFVRDSGNNLPCRKQLLALRGIGTLRTIEHDEFPHNLETDLKKQLTLGITDRTDKHTRAYCTGQQSAGNTNVMETCVVEKK